MKKNTKPSVSHRLATQGGTYSLILSAVVLAILIVLNIFVSKLPGTATKLDMSATKLYSITSNTKAVVNNLKQDVTIYWVTQAGQENQIIENLLDKYDYLSDYITVEKKNPDVYPTFTQQYTEETVPNNSLIVESGTKSRYVSYNDIYQQETAINQENYIFDGEGAISSAIDYVVSDKLPLLYILEGHGETPLTEDFLSALDKENIETATLSLITETRVPEDADCVMIHGPSSDISPEEAQMLIDYTGNGGKLLVMAGPTQNGTLENLYSVLEEYGILAVEGVIVEEDRNNYGFGYPYILMPNLEDSELTTPLREARYHVILPIAQGLLVKDSVKEIVTPLLTTSESSFSKAAGFAMSTHEKEEGDTDGPFSVAVATPTGYEGELIWFSCSTMLDGTYNSYSAGANSDLILNSLSSLIGERDAISIRSKSLNYNYLTISQSTANTIKTLMIGVFPVIYLGVGITVVLLRKKAQK